MIYNFQKIIESPSMFDFHSEKRILVGGCFDLLHAGHIAFLKQAKTLGGLLIVLLESDKAIRHKKGRNRPINTQNNRAVVLQELRSVDHVILLPENTTSRHYYEMTKLIKPGIIATTKGDPNIDQKIHCAQAVGAEVIEVIESIMNKSSTRIAHILELEL